ncbi:MAG: EVE domain-containing protein, partial [Gemmatimonadota bacterium]
MTARKSTAAGRAQPAPRHGASPASRKSAGAPVPAPLAPRFHRYALPRTGSGVRHWLLKTEPDVFSFDDLMRAKDRTTHWDGVRNFQARNFMRKTMRIGDGVLFYHSSCPEPGVVGIAEVASEA